MVGKNKTKPRGSQRQAKTPEREKNAFEEYLAVLGTYKGTIILVVLTVVIVVLTLGLLLAPKENRDFLSTIAETFGFAKLTCAAFTEVPSAQDANNYYGDFKNAVDEAAKGKPANWSTAMAGLQKLVDAHWAIPGIRENLGAANLELEKVGDAKTNVESEFTLLDCLDRDSDDRLPKFLVAPSESQAPPHVREVLKRARAIAQFQMSRIFAQQGEPTTARDRLRLAIANGYGTTVDDLDTLERDRFMAPLRNLPEYDPMLAPLRVRLGR